MRTPIAYLFKPDEEPSKARFEAWLANAAPGDRIIYLAGRLGELASPAKHAAATAWAGGRVLLFQRRADPAAYDGRAGPNTAETPIWELIAVKPSPLAAAWFAPPAPGKARRLMPEIAARRAAS